VCDGGYTPFSSGMGAIDKHFCEGIIKRGKQVLVHSRRRLLLIKPYESCKPDSYQECALPAELCGSLTLCKIIKWRG
jgi:hypothetical protein